jgi:4a-hydroxytetrahydrobiopterin dehydratase
MMKPMTPSAFRASEGVEDWRVLGDGAYVYYRTGSFAESARLVQAIGELPGIHVNLPTVDVREGGVTIRLLTITLDFAGMTERDADVARQISAVARDLSLSADPSTV